MPLPMGRSFKFHIHYSNPMSTLLDSDISAVQRIRDVSNVFTMARAVENPYSTMVPKGAKPRSTLFEQPFKQRITPVDSAVPDGVDVQTGELSNNEANKCMVQGRLQKGRVAISISDLADEFGEEYAATNLMADNMTDAIIAARENLEVTCLKGTASGNAGDSQAYGGAYIPPGGIFSVGPAMTRGIGSWIRSANPAGTPDLPINALALTPSGNIQTGVASASTLTDLDLNTIMQSIATAARMKGTWDVFCSPAMTAVVDALTRAGQITTVSGNSNVPLRRFNNDMANGTITMEVRQFVTSFGKMRFHTHYSLPDNIHCYIVQMEAVVLRPGYAPRTRDIPYLGGGYKKIVEYVYGHMTTNPRSHGMITT